MKKLLLALSMAALMIGAPNLLSEEKATSQEAAKPAEKTITPLRVQIVFTEYDGEKKISSMPYTLLVNADDHQGQAAMIRMGVRVPIETSSSGGAKSFQYQDIGTNLDGRAEKTEDGRFVLKLGVDKSSVYTPGTHEKPATTGGNEISSGQPVIQTFRSQINLLIRDGQTIQTTVATDPITGHVSKVDVTLNVMK